MVNIEGQLVLLNSNELFTKYSMKLSKFFSKYTEEVGWVVFSKDLYSQIERGKVILGIYIVEDEIVGGFYLYNRRDGVSKIYAIAVGKQYLQKGIGTLLLNYLLKLNPKLLVDCIDGIPSNKFYQKYFKLSGEKYSKIGKKINIYTNYES